MDHAGGSAAKMDAPPGRRHSNYPDPVDTSPRSLLEPGGDAGAPGSGTGWYDGLTLSDCPQWDESLVPQKPDLMSDEAVEAIQEYLDSLPAWMRATVENILTAALDGYGSSVGDQPVDPMTFSLVCRYLEEQVCPGRFDPPEPQIRHAAETDAECARLLDDIHAFEHICVAPPILCKRPCVVDTSPSPTLEIRAAKNPFGPTTTTNQSVVDYLNASWNLLEDNLDIVRWVVCLLAGPANADCVVANMSNWLEPQEIVLDDRAPFTHPYNAWQQGDVIRVDVPDGFWKDAFVAFTGVELERFAAASFGAAALLHESVHRCLPWLRDQGDASNNCDRSYMAESAFMWALSRRYPCLLKVFRGIGDYTWMNDQSMDFRALKRSKSSLPKS